VEDISLLGGHDPTTWARDPTLYDSAIDCVDDDGVTADATITVITFLDGFRVNGFAGASALNAAVTVNGGTPWISRNTINGGDVVSGDSTGLHIAGPMNAPAGVVVEGNSIFGGDSAGASAAVHLDGTAPVADITNNTLLGGDGQRSFGLRAWDSGAGTNVHSNGIAAGTSSGGWSRGIQVQGTITIEANFVDGGSCEAPVDWCGGIIVWGSTATVTNNVAFGGEGPLQAGCALLEGEVGALPVGLNGNYCNGGGFALGAGGAPIGDSAGLVVQSTSGNAVTGSIRNNVLEGGSNLNRYGVYEDQGAGLQADPLAFENNDLWIPPTSFVTNDVLYWDESTTALTTIAAVNGLTDISMGVGGNLNADPLFLLDDGTVSGDYHLGVGSPCIDAGTATGAPPTDFDGDARPAGAAVDIGPDET